MNRHNQNNDNRFYAFLPPASSTSSRNSTSQSTHRNDHYQYYDPRLRQQQYNQQNLLEFQYTNRSLTRAPALTYGSPRNHYSFSSSSFLLDDLSTIPSDNIADLGEPISIFDEIQPLERRRSTIVPSLPAPYVPPDPVRRPSVSDVRLATAHVLREQLLSDIERTMNEIDRDLTTLERKPSVPRYLPPRFSPIAENDNHEVKPFRQHTTTLKPLSVSSRDTLLTVTSGTKPAVAQNSARSSVAERHSGSSQYWPNKPKRVYEVIPRLTSDSKRTSRQSSMTMQPDELKLDDIQPAASTLKLRESSNMSTNPRFSANQYHYAPETEEKQILDHDPENIDRKSKLDIIQDTQTQDLLNPTDFLRSISARADSRAVVVERIVRSPLPIIQKGSQQPEVTEEQQTIKRKMNLPVDIEIENTPKIYEDFSDHDEKLIESIGNKDDQSIRQSRPGSLAKSVKETPPSSASKFKKNFPINSARQHLRVPSGNTMTPPPLYHETQDYLEGDSQEETSFVPRDANRARSRSVVITPIASTEDQQEKPPSRPVSNIVIPVPSVAPQQTLEKKTAAGGGGAYFFSDFDNEVDEDLISIDRSNFNAPTVLDNGTDDENMSRVLPQSPGSMSLVQTARQPQQSASKIRIPVTGATNNDYFTEEVEEEKNFEREESDLVKKQNLTPNATLPFTSPSPKQVLPTTIMDDRETGFLSRNNSKTKDEFFNNDNDDEQLQSERDPMYENGDIHGNSKYEDNEEKRSEDSQILVHSSPPFSSHIASRAQSSTSEQMKKSTEHHRSIPSSATPIRNDDPMHGFTETTRRKSTASSHVSSRSRSNASYRMNNDQNITPIDSSRKSSIDQTPKSRALSGERSMSRNSLVDSSRRKMTPLTTRTPEPYKTVPSSDFIVPQTEVYIDRNNEPHVFTVESEHFLRDKGFTPEELNQRLHASHQKFGFGDTPRESLDGKSPLPVPLDSPELSSNEPAPTSRTATPKKQQSIPSIEMPPDPRIILTTMDEPDPENPSAIQSTIQIRMRPMEYDRQEKKSPVQIYSQVETPIRLPSSNVDAVAQRHSPSAVSNQSNDRVSSKSINNIRSPPVSNYDDDKENQEVHSMSPVHQQQDQELDDSTRTPPVSFPTHFQGFTNRTESPMRSSNGHRSPSEVANPLRSVSPIESPMEHKSHSVPSPPKFVFHTEEYPSRSSDHVNNIHSILSPRPETDNEENGSRFDRHFFSDPNYSSSPIPQQSLTQRLLAASRIQSGKEPTFITQTQRHASSEHSVSPSNSSHRYGHLRRDLQLSSASIRGHHKRHSPAAKRSSDNDEDDQYMTRSQQHSKLSLRMKKAESKRKKSTRRSSSPIPHQDTEENSSFQQDNPVDQRKIRARRRRRVSFTNHPAQFQMEERHLLSNWRERVAALLANKHDPHDKYAHVSSKVNSFANFEYQPRKIKVFPKRQTRPKINDSDENKVLKRKKSKVKKGKARSEASADDATDEDLNEVNQQAKDKAPQLFGRLWCLPDGSPTVFHESLEWNVQSRLRGYTLENFNYDRYRRENKNSRKKSKWKSESKLNDLQKESRPSLSQRYFTQSTSGLLEQNDSYTNVTDETDNYRFQKRPDKEQKIFDIQSNRRQELQARYHQQFSDNASYGSFSPKNSQELINNEHDPWASEAQLKSEKRPNTKYKSKKSNVQIFHKSVHWNSEAKIRTRSPSAARASRTSPSRVRIYDEKLNWDAEAKVHCWSEIDLRQVSRKRAIFAQHRDPKWSDIVTARIDTRNVAYPRVGHQVEIFSDRLSWNQESKLKDYVWENFGYKPALLYHPESDHSSMYLPQFRRANTPANRPRWNSVSKKISLNSVYNPKVPESNSIRRGWDRELRRKKVHKLPPLKRKRDPDELNSLITDGPPSTLASTNQLALEYNYDQRSTTQGRTTSNGYVTMSSRRSSKALVPINHFRNTSEMELLPLETPRSQRPVQQEWYEEMSKSRMTNRTEGERVQTTRSFRLSIDSLHHPQTPKDLVTFRSSTRNSQNSVMSGTMLDSSIRSNRATELRLLKDMNDHHQHSHTPDQSMPIAIRGFQLEGTPIIVPDHATIRPLSNVNYQVSERVKSRRVYPWSNLHPLGTSSRNSSLVPIAELRRPSLETTITEAQQLIHEE